MAKIKLEPYIFFNGTAREAMEFYQSVFGGELTLQTYGEAKMGDEGQKDLLMHARLAGDVVIMASDTQKASGKAAKISLSVNGTQADEARMKEIFEKLSQGGSVFSPLKKEFWGDTFGSLTDKYGVEWMMNIEAGSAG